MGKISATPPFISAVVILVLSLFTQGTVSQRSINPDLQKQIDDFIVNFYIPIAETPGLALTIVQDDGDLLYTTGFGLANIEKGIPNQNSTQFCLGSISKSITAMLVVKVLHESFPDLKEAVLDTPIRELVPEVNFTLIDRFRSEQTTFRDLLAHTTCIFDQPVMAEPFNTTEELLYRSRYNDATCSMRTSLAYNNQMIQMAGFLAGVLANTTYEDAMQDMWNEIGMTETAFLQRTDDFREMPNRAMPYYMKDNEVHMFNPELLKRVKVANGAGGIFTTANDMAKYMRFNLNLGSIDGKEIIPKEVMEWLTKSSAIYPSPSFKSSDEDIVLNQFGYGLSLILSSYDGWEMTEHGGFYPPYLNQFSLFPGKKLAIYAGSHMYPFKSLPYILHFAIFEILRGTSINIVKEKTLRMMKQLNAEEIETTKKSEENWQQLFAKIVKKTRSHTNVVDITVGEYGSGNAGDLEISERLNEVTNRTQYFIDYGKWYKGWLEPVPELPGVYRALWVTDVVQEDELLGVSEGRHFVAVDGDDSIILIGTLGLVGTFKLGVSLDTLPVIPWDPNSC